MTKVKVIIVGAGIAGPVLAIFLKARGYDPIIYERLPGPGEGGLSFTYMPALVHFSPILNQTQAAAKWSPRPITHSRAPGSDSRSLSTEDDSLFFVGRKR